MDDNDDLDYGPEDLVSPRPLVLATIVLRIDMYFRVSYDASILGHDLLLYWQHARWMSNAKQRDGSATTLQHEVFISRCAD